ncbi:MAG TPA: hypothetical protein ENI56_02685 [Candidatus Kaiserbacteria bacterium]|nr:hypothetical protein [Candidatus Kaiserbacteria bacterium]
MTLFVIITAVSVVHALSAFLGAASITIAQWQYFRARRDGHIDEGERAHLVTLFFSVRYALVTFIITHLILGLLLLTVPHVFTGRFIEMYLFEFGVAVVLAVTSWLRFHARIPFWAGSAIAFVGWWYLAEIDLGYLVITGAVSATLGFIANIIIVAGLFAVAHWALDKVVHRA